MKRTLITSGLTGAGAFLPLLALAQGGVRDANSLIDFLLSTINAIIPILVAFAVLFFLFGLIQFILAKGDDKKEARGTMIWGIVIIFVMVSVWGLVNLLVNSFGLDNSPVDLPEVTGR